MQYFFLSSLLHSVKYKYLKQNIFEYSFNLKKLISSLFSTTFFNFINFSKGFNKGNFLA